MSGPRDDFLDALTHQVKYEVINNYLRERLVLEEEIKEYREKLEEYRGIEAEALVRKEELACLLAGPENFREFFRLMGFSEPPFRRLVLDNDFHWAPACPLELSPKGFTKKGQYINLTIKAYERFHEKIDQARLAAEDLLKLADEINRDIRTFHLNFDIMAIINFLKSMDVDTVLKKKFMGDNFGPMEIASLEQTMHFSNLKPEAEGVRIWPEIPTPQQARGIIADFLGELFKREKQAILPALT
jgi:hypothetical protein